MFGRKKPGVALDPATFLTKFVEHQFDTERMKDAARASRRSIAVLMPQIPIGAGTPAGWLGGDAALPAGMPWPERDGRKLLFVGQIDLSVLPADLWSGVGPRAGWLGIFVAADDATPVVLHFDGPLVRAAAPPSKQAHWARFHDFAATATFVLPRWPLAVDVRPGSDLHDDEDEEEPREPGPDALLDPAFHPFDRKTTALLCETYGDAVTHLARDVARFPAMKKLRPADADWFARQRPVMLETFARFFAIEGRLRTTKLPDPDLIARIIAELAQLDTYDMHYPRTDAEGNAELVLRPTKLLDPHSPGSPLALAWSLYDAGLTTHANHAYTTDPATLPAPLRTRMEARWMREARHGLAVMGHAPRGHIYTPHGPDTPNEVLLELPTSKLTGMIWGDCHALVLLIDREALRRGDFTQVTAELTN